jgi:hypothetical protein
MFRFRRWLLWAILGFGLRLGASPPLTTIQDVLFNSDGSRFNGVVTISWQSFEASDTTNIAASSERLEITNGILYVQLVPTTNANSPAVYAVQFNGNAGTVYTEAWAVPPTSSSLRVRDVRLAPGTVTGSAQTPSLPLGTGSSGNAAKLQISDITGLQSALNVRPVQGAAFAISRAAVLNALGAIDGATGNLTDCLHVDGTSGPCGTGGGTGGTSTGTFVDAEPPSGAMDGANAAFTLANAPTPPSSLEMFRNGLLLKQGNDYTVSGNAVTFTASAIPQPADLLLASYRLSVTLSGIGFVDTETPAGTVNGSNATFTLSQVPNPATSLDVFRNGIRLASGVDYTLSNSALTFLPSDIPQTGDILLCSYRVTQ